MALFALFCVLLGILPTYVIPVIDRAATPLAHESVVAALVPPFFNADVQLEEKLPPAFVSEFHDLGAQVGPGVFPGRGLIVLHRGGESNPVVFARSTSYTVLVFAELLAVTFAIFRLLTLGRGSVRGAVWDGGLRQLPAAFTYTATGFSNPVRVVFDAVLRPSAVEDRTEGVAEHFRTAIRRDHAEVHRALEPPVRALRGPAAIVRKMHVGHVNAYAA